MDRLVKRKQKFTMISNAAIADDRLKLKDLGLLLKLLSFSDNWEFSVNGLNAVIKNDGRDSIRNSLKNLEECGYLQRHQTRDEKGRLGGTIWYITDELPPFTENPSTVIQTTDIPFTENPTTDNTTQYNTKQINTKQINTKNNIDYNQSIYQEEDIKEQIGYETFNDDRIDEIVLLIKEILNSNKETIRINKENKSTKEVKNVFLKLNKLHIDYVLYCLDHNSTEIKNIKAYIISCLYNASFTMNSYYDAKVRHDLGY